MKTMLWLQTGTCGGETQAVLCADGPAFEQLLMPMTWNYSGILAFLDCPRPKSGR